MSLLLVAFLAFSPKVSSFLICFELTLSWVSLFKEEVDGLAEALRSGLVEDLFLRLSF